MTKYSSLLKGKLQELLTARGLPIDGTKEVLIERLEESDKIAAELEADDEPEVNNGADKVQDFTITDSSASIVAGTEDVKNDVEDETKDVNKEEFSVTTDISPTAPDATSPTSEDTNNVATEKKVVEEPPNPETLKAAAVELLTMKINRAQKFGEEEQVSILKANLTRVEKFGVELDSALARELGFAPPTGPKATTKGSNHNNQINRNHNRKRKPFNRRGHQNYGNGNNRSHVQQGRVYKTR